jgi:hypothetical protein
LGNKQQIYTNSPTPVVQKKEIIFKQLKIEIADLKSQAARFDNKALLMELMILENSIIANRPSKKNLRSAGNKLGKLSDILRVVKRQNGMGR